MLSINLKFVSLIFVFVLIAFSFMGCSLKNFEQKTPPAATLPEKKVEANPETKISDEEVSKEKSKENNSAALIPSSEEQPSEKKAITSDNTDIQNVKISSSVIAH